jgi:hypothetical protein
LRVGVGSGEGEGSEEQECKEDSREACGFHNGLFQGSKRRRVAGGWSPSSGWLVKRFAKGGGSRVAGRGEAVVVATRRFPKRCCFKKGRGDVQMQYFGVETQVRLH